MTPTRYRSTSYRHRAISALLCGALIAGLAPAASADPIQPQQPAPIWSGLDATEYSGRIPNAGGTLLKEVPLDKRVTLSSAGKASRFLYTTLDSHGQMVVSTGALFLPRQSAPRGGYPVVAWAHGTVGLGDDCTPSAGTRYDRDVRYLNHWLRQGYAVVASDYVGLGTPGIMAYLDGKTSAYNIIDSVRAVQASRLGHLSPKWVVVGQSQGAGVALFTARYATAYSTGSRLHYRGAVATGTPAYVEDALMLASPVVPVPSSAAGLTTYILYILAGFRDARPNIGLNDVLSDTGKKWALEAQKLCYGALHKKIEDERLTVASLFSRPLASIPGIHAALREYMGIPVTGYDQPIFMGQGGRDTDVITPSTVRLAAEMKLAQQPVEFHFYPSYDHSQTVNGSLKDSTPFVARVLR